MSAIKSYKFEDAKYTLVIKDASAVPNGKIRIRYYNNSVAERMGVPCLDALDISVDELINVLNKFRTTSIESLWFDETIKPFHYWKDAVRKIEGYDRIKEDKDYYLKEDKDYYHRQYGIYCEKIRKRRPACDS